MCGVLLNNSIVILAFLFLGWGAGCVLVLSRVRARRWG